MATDDESRRRASMQCDVCISSSSRPSTSQCRCGTLTYGIGAQRPATATKTRCGSCSRERAARRRGAGEATARTRSRTRPAQSHCRWTTMSASCEIHQPQVALRAAASAMGEELQSSSGLPPCVRGPLACLSGPPPWLAPRHDVDAAVLQGARGPCSCQPPKLCSSSRVHAHMAYTWLATGITDRRCLPS